MRWLVALLLVGCGSDDCKTLASQMTAAVTAPQSCTADADCVIASTESGEGICGIAVTHATAAEVATLDSAYEAKKCPFAAPPCPAPPKAVCVNQACAYGTQP